MDEFDDLGEISYEKSMLLMTYAREAVLKAGRILFLLSDIPAPDGKMTFQFGLVDDTTFGFTFD